MTLVLTYGHRTGDTRTTWCPRSISKSRCTRRQHCERLQTVGTVSRDGRRTASLIGYASDTLSDVALYPEDINPVVRQVMNRDVIFLKETQTVRDAIQIFLSSGFSGAPVLDQNRHLIGILSETDIIKKEAGVIDALKRASWANNNLDIQHLPSDLQQKPKTRLLLDTPIKASMDTTVGLYGVYQDVMSVDPISIDPEMSIVDAASLMINSEVIDIFRRLYYFYSQVNRFPVVEDDRVIGILTRGDILQCMIWEILIAGGSVDE